MPMATEQRKRRFSSTATASATAFGYGFQDQNRAKRRDLNINSHVSLKWDDKGNRVVAKDDQIGISSRHFSSFIGSASSSTTKLADVVTVPRDLFELKDLSHVLSYEVWQSVLTEKERNSLAQFLPYGVEADEAVRTLCSGDNFHFGNPLVKWASSVCSGDLHPDAVLQHEKSFKANKRAYYSELQLYHDNMIRNLQNLKQTCASSKDPEAAIRQITLRLKRHEKSVIPDANGEKYHKPDENVASMSESLSPADEKFCYSDNQKLSVIRDTEMQKRMRNQDFMKDKHENSIMPPSSVKVLSRPKKAEKIQRPMPTPNDGAKYMSYVKISKKQHELVKNMKQSGSSIQSRALNRLLAGLDSSNVKPYEMFVEEEHKRIHEHWLHLANKDIPFAFQIWRSLQLTKRKLIDSLWKEFEVKLGGQSKDMNLVNHEEPAPAHDEVNGESSHGTSEDHQDDERATQKSSSDNKEESEPTSSMSKSPLETALNVNEVIDPSSLMETPLQNPNLNVNEELDPSSPMKTQSLKSHPPNVNEEFDPSSPMETQSLQSHSLNVNEEFDPSAPMETQSLQSHPLNVSEEFDPSSPIETQSLQNRPLNVNEDFDPSSMETRLLGNPSLNVKDQFDMSASLENQSFHSPPMNVKEELDSVHHPPLNVNESYDPILVENKSSMEDKSLAVLESIQHPSLNVNERVDSISEKDKSLVESKSLLNCNEDYTMDLNAENNTSEASDICNLPEQHIVRTSEASPNVSHSGVRTSATGSNAVGMPGSSSLKNMWSSIALPESYHSHPTTLHPSSGGLFLRHPQLVTNQPAQVLDLGSDMPEKDSTKDLLNRHASHSPLFDPYAPDRDRSELLHSLIKPDNFHQQQKKTNDFHQTNVLLETADQFPAHFREHLQQSSFPLDNQRRKAQSELFMHQNIQDNIYSDNNRYSVRGPEPFSSLNVRDWSNTRLSNSVQPPQLNSGELLNHNWFATNANRDNGGWASSNSTVFPARNIGNVSSSSDQSLYSVLTQCNMRPQAPFCPAGSTEQMIPPANYAQEVVGVMPMASNALPPPVSPFDYLSGGETSATLKNPDLGWMSLGHQPSGLQDPSGKPFL